MSYENSAQCKMLATRCASCGRPLVDALSVEYGIGPECRKYIDEELNELTDKSRQIANAIIYKIAMDQGQTSMTFKAIDGLIKLGFMRTALKLARRFVDVKLYYDAENIYVQSKKNPLFIWKARDIGGEWMAEVPSAGVPKKVWKIPKENKDKLFMALKRCYPGQTGIGAKGIFSL